MKRGRKNIFSVSNEVHEIIWTYSLHIRMISDTFRVPINIFYIQPLRLRKLLNDSIIKTSIQCIYKLIFSAIEFLQLYYFIPIIDGQKESRIECKINVLEAQFLNIFLQIALANRHLREMSYIVFQKCIIF